jgi:hypothetical protein
MSTDDREALSGWEHFLRYLRAEKGIDVNSPLRWRYRFDAWERGALELLARQLQQFGYESPRIDASLGEDCFSLTVEIVEQRTPQLMLQRERELQGLVHRDGEGQPWFHSMQFSPVPNDG